MSHSQGHVCQCLGRVRGLRRGSPVVIAGDRRRTGEVFVEGVLSLARGLSDSGIRRGDVVAIAALNSDWYLEWLLAITYIGGIAAPLNYRWSFEEARSAMEVVNPVMLVVDKSCSSWALALLNSGNSKIRSPMLYAFIGDSSPPSLRDSGSVLKMDSLRRPSHGAPELDLIWAPKDVAIICFTSGTTGRPKGVGISHAALIVQSLAKIAIVGYGVPPYSSSMPHWWDIFLCSNANGRKANRRNGGETVNKILNGGGGLLETLVTSATHIFPRAKILSAYGMTEACSSLTFTSLRDPTPQNAGKFASNNNKAKSNKPTNQNTGVFVGRPASHIELRICGNNDSSGSPLIGSIFTRGLHVMVGYWDGTTASILDSIEQGWLDTGDVGWLDDNGDLWLIGRKKDCIKSGGENVYPEEVEAVLSQHPGVLNAVVIGIPDIRLTEKVIACVAMGEGWKWIHQKLGHSPEINELSDGILQNYCRQKNLSGNMPFLASTRYFAEAN